MRWEVYFLDLGYCTYLACYTHNVLASVPSGLLGNFQEIIKKAN